MSLTDRSIMLIEGFVTIGALQKVVVLFAWAVMVLLRQACWL